MKLIKKIKIEYVFLAIIITVSSFLRLEGVFSNSFPFTYDIGRDLIAVRGIANLDKISLIGPTTGMPGLFYGPWWYYILTVPYIFSSGNPQGITFFIALTGILSVVIGYFLGKKIGGTFLGLVLAAFLGLSPAMPALTNQIWSPDLIPILTMLAFYVLYKLFDCKKNKMQILYLFLLGIILGLIIDMEIILGLLLSFGLIVSLFFMKLKLIRIKNYLFLALGLFSIFLPRIIFDVRHHFVMTLAVLNQPQSSTLPQESGVLFVNVSSKFAAFKNYWLESIAGYNEILGVILALFVLLVIIKFYKKMTGLEGYFVNIICFSIVIYFLGMLFLAHDVWQHYFFVLPILYIFLLSIAFSVWYRIGKSYYKIILVLLLLVVNIFPIYLEHKKPAWEGNETVYRNQIAVINYIYKQANGKKFKYIIYTPPVIDYTYQYLFSWYGKNKYGYVPEKNKSELLFVILEPDYYTPWNLKEWIKARKNDGKIIKEEIVKGGVTVQTRITD